MLKAPGVSIPAGNTGEAVIYERVRRARQSYVATMHVVGDVRIAVKHWLLYLSVTRRLARARLYAPTPAKGHNKYMKHRLDRDIKYPPRGPSQKAGIQREKWDKRMEKEKKKNQNSLC